MQISKAGAELIKRFEGFRAKAYQDGAGVWTIGFGHIKDVHPGDMMTRDQADRVFDHEVAHFAATINTMIHVPVTQNQFDALCSFAYNEGTEALRASTLLKYVNANEFEAAAGQFARWNKLRDPKTKALVVSDGLTKRRSEERALFLTP